MRHSATVRLRTQPVYIIPRHRQHPCIFQKPRLGLARSLAFLSPVPVPSEIIVRVSMCILWCRCVTSAQRVLSSLILFLVSHRLCVLRSATFRRCKAKCALVGSRDVADVTKRVERRLLLVPIMLIGHAHSRKWAAPRCRYAIV